MSVDTAGRFLYATNSLANTVSVFEINTATGTLSALTAVSAGSSPVAVAIVGEVR
jgi:YVTN family beta-propeller protein